MATTPRGIEYPTTASQVTPLANVFATMASSVDTALGNLDTALSAGANHYTGTNAARIALTAPALHEGIMWYATDTNLIWVYRDTTWKVLGGRPIVGRVIKNTGQSSSVSPAVITWNSSSAIINTDSFYSTGSNTRLTIPYAGLYRVGFTLKSTGIVAISAGVLKNGSTYLNEVEGAAVGASGAGTCVQASDIIALNAGDYLEVRHNAASAGVSFNVASCRFQAEFIGQL